MTPNVDDMDQAERESYWLELHDGGYRIMEGETKDESEEVASGDGFFAGAIQEVDRDAGDYDDSRLYHLRHEDYDRPILLWGKTDLDTKVDNAMLQTGDVVAIQHVDTEEVEARDGSIQDMNVYDVRYDKL